MAPSPFGGHGNMRMSFINEKPANISRSTRYPWPLSTYVNVCGSAGLAVNVCEGLLSHCHGPRGVRFRVEDGAAKEISLFLVFGLVRSSDGAGVK